MCKESWCVRLWKKGVLWGWGMTVWNTLKGGGTEKNEEETKILKTSGQSGSRGGCLKIERRGAGTLLRTKAGLPQLVYEEICSKFCFKMHISFLGWIEKIANSDWKLLWQPY